MLIDANLNIFFGYMPYLDLLGNRINKAMTMNFLIKAKKNQL